MRCSMQKIRRILPLWKAVLIVTVMATAAIHFARSGDAAPPPAQVVPDAAEQRMFLERSREEHNARVTWQPVSTMTFDNAASLQPLRVMEGKWEIANGQLQAMSGKADDDRTILVAPCPAGPVRLEFDATLFARPDGRIGDIGIRLNADPTTGSFERGYAFITAQYWNQATVCYKLNIPIARTEWSPIVPGKRHHVVVEWTDKHLRLFVDERIVLDAWDRDTPLPPDPAKWIGLSTYDTRMAIDNLVISTSPAR